MVARRRALLAWCLASVTCASACSFTAPSPRDLTEDDARRFLSAEVTLAFTTVGQSFVEANVTAVVTSSANEALSSTGLGNSCPFEPILVDRRRTPPAEVQTHVTCLLRLRPPAVIPAKGSIRLTQVAIFSRSQLSPGLVYGLDVQLNTPGSGLRVRGPDVVTPAFPP